MKYMGKELYYTTLVTNHRLSFAHRGETLCTKAESEVIYDEINNMLVLAPNFEDSRLVKDGIVYAAGLHDLKSLKCDGPDINDYESLLRVASEINLNRWANIYIPVANKDLNNEDEKLILTK